MNEARYECHNPVRRPPGHLKAKVRFGDYPKDYCYWVPERWAVAPGDELWVNAAGAKKKVWVRAISGLDDGTYKVAMQRVGKRPGPAPEDTRNEVELSRGDWVLVRQHPNPEQYNFTPGFENMWCEEMGEYMGRPFKVHHIAPSGVTLEDAGCYRFPPQMLEPLKVAQRDPVEVGNEIHTRLADMDFAELEQRVLAQMLDRVLPYVGKSDCFPYFFTHSPDRYTKPNPEETPVSIKIETITYVNDIPVHDLSDDAVFEIISRAEKEIERLQGISSRPIRITNRIDELRRGINELVKLLDARDKKDEEAKAD